MVLELRELTDADLPAFVNVYIEAFRDGPVSKAKVKGGYTPDFVDFCLKKDRETFKERNVWHIGVFDTDLEELICVARWKFQDKAYTNAPKKASEWYPGANIEAKEAFFGMNSKARHSAMGREKSYWHLSLLATNPRHERRGAGRLAIEWGTGKADCDGLDTFLNATPVGKPLYERAGFIFISEQSLDLHQFGVEYLYRASSMVRSPTQRE